MLKTVGIPYGSLGIGRCPLLEAILTTFYS